MKLSEQAHLSNKLSFLYFLRTVNVYRMAISIQFTLLLLNILKVVI